MGFNLEVFRKQIQTIFFPIMLYAGVVWMRETNMKEIQKLWYKISKSATGAVFNVNQPITEVIIGIPPPLLINDLNCVKHYLKLIHDQPTDTIDPLVEYISTELSKGDNKFLNLQMKGVFKFLHWKINLDLYKSNFHGKDMLIIQSKDYDNFCQLSSSACWYSKTIMNYYTEHLWQEQIKTSLQLLGKSRIPKVTQSTIPFPYGTSRVDQVKVMSLFYKNNLLNDFLFKTQRKQCPSPLCECGLEEQTAFHLVSSCSLTPDNVKDAMMENMMKYNGTTLIEDEISLINCSRDKSFIKGCLQVVQNGSLKLRSKIQLL